MINEYAGLAGKSTFRIEAACATGSAAIKTAVDAIASGEADISLVVGVEKMNESLTPVVVEFIGRSGNYFWEFQNFSLTFPGYYALYATYYMFNYGVKEEDLCLIAVKNHHYASMNPKAHFQRKITVDECMKSRYIAWPLKLYDSCPISDGSASIILASEEIATKITDTPIWIEAIGSASDTSNITRRKDFTGLYAARKAASEAYKKLCLIQAK